MFGLNLLTDNEIEKLQDEAFQLGVRTGEHQGYQKGVRTAIAQSKELTNEEITEIYKFLIDRGIEFVIAPVSQLYEQAGLLIRKRVYPNRNEHS